MMILSKPGPFGGRGRLEHLGSSLVFPLRVSRFAFGLARRLI